MVDTDGDGMPDVWEVRYGLNPNDPGGADREAVRTIQDANYIIYRMADVMLMKAEALIRIGGSANWITT